MRLVDPLPGSSAAPGPFTDVQRARDASTMLLGVFGAQLALTVLSRVVAWLMPSSFDSPWQLAEELLWLTLGVAIIIALLRLGGTLADRSLVGPTVGTWVVMTLVDFASAVVFHFQRTSSFHLGEFTSVLLDLQYLVTLGARALLFIMLSRLTMATRAWVMPLLAVSWLMSAARFAMIVAINHQLATPELYRNEVWRIGGLLSTFYGVLVTVAAGWAVRAVAFESVGAQAVPPREVGNHAAPVEPAASPTGDFVFGAILLLVGIGVTMVSMSAASNGGRYLVATGAIGTGIGRLIRGFIRLGKTQNR